MELKRLLQITFIIICSNVQVGLSQFIPGSNASTCLTTWINLPAPPSPSCTCLKLMTTVPAGTTFMSSPRLCLQADARSHLISYDGATEQASITGMAGPMAAMMGISNVPVGLYLDNANNIRHLNDQMITPPLTGVIGKCQYLLATGNLATNNSCLQQPTSVICMMDCDFPPMPPPPSVTNGTSRCNVPNFNMTCAAGWINLGGLCYKNPVDSNTLLNNFDAAKKCEDAGGWLPNFVNLNEWQAVMNYVYYQGISGPDSWAAPMWLGGTLTGTTASWDDGTPWTFQYWAPYMPLGQSECFWWSVGQGDYWSEGNCTVPGVAFCQFYSCPTTTMASTSTTSTTTATPTTTTTTPTTTTTTSTTTTTTAIPTTTTSTTTTVPTVPTTTTTTATSTTTTAIPTTTTSTTTTIPTVPTTTTTTTTKLNASTSAVPNTVTASTTNTMPKTTIQTVTNTPSIATSTTAATTKSTTVAPSSTTSSTTSLKAVVTNAPTTVKPTNSNLCSDFTTKDSIACKQPNSFWSAGICYTLYTNTMAYNHAATQCSNVGSQLAVVRSSEIGGQMGQIYMQAYPSATNLLVWLGSPDEGKAAYNQIAGIDLQGNVVVVNVTNGQCLAMSANAASGNKLFIFDNSSCTDVNPYFCETRSTFLQKGCDQTLNSVAVVSETVSSLALCTQICAQTATCTGVNYNDQNQICKCLDENTCQRNLICEPGWNYFERV